jgi:AcrR family transcriptional regulator
MRMTDIPTRLPNTDGEPRARRLTQGERTARMRHRLLGATMDCLRENGFSGCSTNDVVKRAGVTRGALFHHFPTKHALIAEALWEDAKRRLSENKKTLEAAVDAGEPLEVQLRHVWKADSESFFPFTEMALAARVDPELQHTYIKVREEAPSSDANTSRVAWATAEGDPSPLLTRYVVGCFLNGLNLASVFSDEAVLEATFGKFVEILGRALESMGESAGKADVARPARRVTSAKAAKTAETADAKTDGSEGSA